MSIRPVVFYMSARHNAKGTEMTTYRVLGTTDEVTTCEICGREELKGTIVLGVLDADGNVEAEMYAGSSCGAKAAGRTGRNAAGKLRDEADAVTRKVKAEADDARKMREHYGWHRRPFVEVVNEFRAAHYHAAWAASTTPEGWAEMTQSMISRRNDQIIAGIALGFGI